MHEQRIHAMIIGHRHARIPVKLQHYRTAAVAQKPLMRRCATAPSYNTSKMPLIPVGHRDRIGNLQGKMFDFHIIKSSLHIIKVSPSLTHGGSPYSSRGSSSANSATFRRDADKSRDRWPKGST